MLEIITRASPANVERSARREQLHALWEIGQKRS